MSGQADKTGTAGAGGVFQRIADLVVRWPLVVVGFWILLAAGLPTTFPSLTEIAQKHPAAILPPDAPVTVTTRQMTKAFHESGSENVLLVVLTSDKGGANAGPADEGVYRALVDRLHQDTRDVVMLQDFVSTPFLRDSLMSKDGRALMLAVGLAGDLGTPPSYAAYTRVAKIVKQTVAGSHLTVNLAGPAATVADLTDTGERDLNHVELAMAIMLLVVLLIIYRNPLTMLLPLVTIGVSLVTAQAIVAGLAEHGLGISSQTIIFISAMMAGSGTDYAVFLISRYHDYVRLGADSDQAVKRALMSVGKVIAASAATVAVTFLAMIFTRLTAFSTAGPALAIAIGVAFVAAVTLLPAILVLAGRRGWVSPRRDLTTRFWRRSGIRIVRRPKTNLFASLIVLIILASCAGLVHYNYDDRKILPSSVHSAVGYAALESHFPVSSTIPQYLFVDSPQDLRTPQALADLEQMAQRVSQLPDIAMVRGVTRPTGVSLQQARLSYQAGEVGDELSTGSRRITDQAGDLNRLAKGANQLADTLVDVRGQVRQAIGSIRGLVESLYYLQNQFGGDRTLNQIDITAKLVNAIRALGDSIGVNFANLLDVFRWSGPVVTALNASPICDADPICSNWRGQMQRLVSARDDGALDTITRLARQLQSTQDAQTLASTAKGLGTSLNAAMRSLGLTDLGSVQPRLATVQQGADKLADASRQVADGVQTLVDQTQRLGAGLGAASTFLLAMKNDAGKPPMAGFYLPQKALDLESFKKMAAIFISPDGHAARYLIQTKLNPFSTAAMDQVNSITDTARGAQPNTMLADAKISMAGYPALLRDTRNYYDRDIRFIIVVTVVVVFLILTLLLRAVVAPLYMIGSVVVSYLSALGIGVILFQFILGQQLHWSIPGLAFIILVSVGADYNMLLISRLKDESPLGVRSGIIRTVGSTGGVITAAGLIFAASMFSLLFASISTLVQVGFLVGTGTLLDTFLVRTITVPAIAALVGRANWWPPRWWPSEWRRDRTPRRRPPLLPASAR